MGQSGQRCIPSIAGVSIGDNQCLHRRLWRHVRAIAPPGYFRGIFGTFVVVTIVLRMILGDTYFPFRI